MPTRITPSDYFSPIRLVKIQKFDNCWQEYKEIGTLRLFIVTQNVISLEKIRISNNTT